MNLRVISDSDLLRKTDELVKQERELLTEILHHLREIERRRLFSQLGYKSLFDYATKKLGYAECQAMRRISAMRLLKELPELEEKIASGALTLTNLSMAQTLFRQEQKRENAQLPNLPLLAKGQSESSASKATFFTRSVATAGFTKQQKLDLLSQLENKPKREAEKIIISRSSEPKQLSPDKVRAVTENLVEYKFMAKCELQQKLETVKGLLAHSHPNMSMGEVIDKLCDIAIKNIDPSQKHGRVSKSQKSATSLSPAIKRRIDAATHRLVWQRAGSKCEICGSTYALQKDHIIPKALGGSDSAENLRLLCRSCNQRQAITKLGLAKMDHYLERRR